MELQRLLEALPEYVVEGDPRVDIAGLSYDSRTVRPGELFFAIRGFQHDGHDFIPEALNRGAVGAVVERDVPNLPLTVHVSSTREALALLASRFYDDPSKKLRVIGVTGTNGKTTTTHLIRNILVRAGYEVGLLGTVHNIIGGISEPVKHTTPESLDLQELLARLVQAKSDYVVMEVSSHALELKRVFATEFDVGVLTNITQDHLDFHGTFENYRDAKARLFRSLGQTYQEPLKEGAKRAVVNVDDPSGPYIIQQCSVEVVTYGVNQRADVWAEDIRVGGHGASFRLWTPQGTRRLTLNLTGRFNIYNSLAAIAVGLAEEVPLDVVVAAMEDTRGVPGRFEQVDEGQDFTVIVDYAHTPDGLENILLTAREFTRGRIIVVFGAGGDRDRLKRPVMGEIAARYADFSIITSDNPRSEDPEAIIDEIEVGVRRRTEHYARQVDRRQAIAQAIAMAQPGDVVIIAGKGHEDYQIFRDRTIHFDDREAAREILRERLQSGSGKTSGSEQHEANGKG